MKIEYIGLNDAAAMPCLGPSRVAPIMFSAENDYLGEILSGNQVNPPTRAPTATNIYPIQISHISIVRIIGGKEAFYRLAEGIPYPQPAANGLTYQQLLNTVLPRISQADKNYCRDYLADAKPSKAGVLNFLDRCGFYMSVFRLRREISYSKNLNQSPSRAHLNCAKVYNRLVSQP